MPSEISDYGKNYYAGMAFGGYSATTPPYPIPATYWVAMLTAPATPDMDGTMISEPPTANNYGRVQIANDTTVWGAPAGGVVANIVPILFQVATINDWPTVMGYAFCDAQTGGNVYMTGTLRLPRVVSVGHLAKFDSGFLTVSVNRITQSIVPTA